MSFLRVFFSDKKIGISQDDFVHCSSKSKDLRSLGFVIEDDNVRYSKIIYLNGFENSLKTGSTQIYTTAKVECWVDLNGNNEVVVKQADDSCSLSIDHIDVIKNQRPITGGMGMTF